MAMSERKDMVEYEVVGEDEVQAVGGGCEAEYDEDDCGCEVEYNGDDDFLDEYCEDEEDAEDDKDEEYDGE